MMKRIDIPIGVALVFLGWSASELVAGLVAGDNEKVIYASALVLIVIGTSVVASLATVFLVRLAGGEVTIGLLRILKSTAFDMAIFIVVYWLSKELRVPFSAWLDHELGFLAVAVLIVVGWRCVWVRLRRGTMLDR